LWVTFEVITAVCLKQSLSDSLPFSGAGLEAKHRNTNLARVSDLRRPEEGRVWREKNPEWPQAKAASGPRKN
jgi:hypothetical protein